MTGQDTLYLLHCREWSRPWKWERRRWVPTSTASTEGWGRREGKEEEDGGRRNIGAVLLRGQVGRLLDMPGMISSVGSGYICLEFGMDFILIIHLICQICCTNPNPNLEKPTDKIVTHRVCSARLVPVPSSPSCSPCSGASPTSSTGTNKDH